MSYRSDIKLILTDKGMKMLRSKVEKPPDDEPYSPATPIYEASKINDGKYWLVEWEQVKWYAGYGEDTTPEIVEQVLCLLRMQDEPYQFMRTGEDYDDTTFEAVWSDEPMPHLALKREIEVNY